MNITINYIVLFTWRRETRDIAKEVLAKMFGEERAMSAMKCKFVFTDSAERAKEVVEELNRVRCSKVSQFVFTATAWQRI